ncbi:hypothetical protein BH23THE1_BH23THE1_17690 [soil metagenome]|jgi:hypothetical protein
MIISLNRIKDMSKNVILARLIKAENLSNKDFGRI